MKLDGDIAFSQIVLHMDHIGRNLVQILMLTKHVQDMIRARGVISQTFKHYYLGWSCIWAIFLIILMLIKDLISDR